MPRLRCGDCGLPVEAVTYADGRFTLREHACAGLPTGRQLGEWLYLQPDDEDLRHATYVLLPPCPFCGATAGPPITRLRESTGIFQTEISCSRDTLCGATVFYNGWTKEEARTKAIERWTDRRPAAERQAEREAKRRGEK